MDRYTTKLTGTAPSVSSDSRKIAVEATTGFINWTHGIGMYNDETEAIKECAQFLRNLEHIHYQIFGPGMVAAALEYNRTLQKQEAKSESTLRRLTGEPHPLTQAASIVAVDTAKAAANKVSRLSSKLKAGARSFQSA